MFLKRFPEQLLERSGSKGRGSVPAGLDPSLTAMVEFETTGEAADLVPDAVANVTPRHPGGQLAVTTHPFCFLWRYGS